MKTRRRIVIPVQAPWSVQVEWIRGRVAAGWSDEKIARAIRLPIESVQGAKTWTDPSA